jgi:hypothetical protein
LQTFISGQEDKDNKISQISNYQKDIQKLIHISFAEANPTNLINDMTDTLNNVISELSNLIPRLPTAMELNTKEELTESQSAYLGLMCSMQGALREFVEKIRHCFDLISRQLFALSMVDEHDNNQPLEGWVHRNMIRNADVQFSSFPTDCLNLQVKDFLSAASFFSNVKMTLMFFIDHLSHQLNTNAVDPQNEKSISDKINQLIALDAELANQTLESQKNINLPTTLKQQEINPEQSIHSREQKNPKAEKQPDKRPHNLAWTPQQFQLPVDDNEHKKTKRQAIAAGSNERSPRKPLF